MPAAATAPQVPPEALESIKQCELLVNCLKSLKEVSLEFLTVDSRTCITDHPLAAVR